MLGYDNAHPCTVEADQGESEDEGESESEYESEYESESEDDNNPASETPTRKGIFREISVSIKVLGISFKVLEFIV
jgi:hypothetical protein